jgi:hypothetical protein
MWPNAHTGAVSVSGESRFRHADTLMGTSGMFGCCYLEVEKFGFALDLKDLGFREP